MNPQELADFFAWVESDPRHAEAMVKMGARLSILSATYRRVQPGTARAARGWRFPLPSMEPRVVRWTARAGGLAIAGVVAVVISTPVPDVYQTGVGEIRTIELRDSSTVTLAGGTRLTIEIGLLGRRLVLESGEALFEVAKDSYRPFRVQAGDRIVQAVGTRFDVQAVGPVVNVAVAEGTVLVAPRGDTRPSYRPGQHQPDGAALQVGQAVSYDAATPLQPVRRIDPAQVADWRNGRFVANNLSFASVVDMVRRQFGGTYRIEDPVIAVRLVNVMLPPKADRALALTMLETAAQVRAEQTGPDTVTFRQTVAATIR
jgi:transmembrane sensor